MNNKLIIAGIVIAMSVACHSQQDKKEENAGKADVVAAAASEQVNLPAPFATKSVKNYCEVIGWPQNKTPTAPAGFVVNKFADGLANPRWIYVGPNGDIFVCETNGINSNFQSAKSLLNGKKKSGNVGSDESANRITLFRDANNDGIPESKHVFLTGLNHPFGMLILKDHFYVANNDAVVMYPYKMGDTNIAAAGKKIVDLPTGSGHWTRNIIASKDGKKILIAVGSGSNVAEKGLEKELRRANILEVNPDGSNERIYAAGLRNPQGMGYAPGSNTLWTAVNERDELGDDLVPDYLTSVKDGGFYGWPFAYWGQHADPRLKDDPHPEMVSKSIVPDVSMGAHTASLGLAFDDNNLLKGKYGGGAFVGQHGSWNRAQLSGYEVAFVPFKNGKPAGGKEDFLTGFIADSANQKVYGRPVGVAFTKKGSMLVADDASNTVWCVRQAEK